MAFAHPRWSGREKETQRAFTESGFPSGRMHDPRDVPCIVPNAETVQENWFAPPSLVMQSYDFECGE